MAHQDVTAQTYALHSHLATITLRVVELDKSQKRGKSMSHTICHLEIPTTDVKKSGEFYKKLFNWKIDYSMGENYAIFSTGEEQLGGGLDSSEEARSLGKIIIYIQVDDINAMLEKVEKLGAKKVTGKTEIPNVGWFGLFTDLDGNTIGLFTPKG